MLDKYTTRWVKPPLLYSARLLERCGIKADQLTLLGFALGLAAMLAVALQAYSWALLLLLANRILDGLDGALARLSQPTDAGGFLDITLDFIFYSGLVWAFALANPAEHGLAAATLIFSFIGTGGSFLAFSALAERRQIKHPDFGHKSLYYIGGLAEGTETILVFIAFCLWPQHFVALAYGFALICALTTVTRIWAGYRTLKVSDQTE